MHSREPSSNSCRPLVTLLILLGVLSPLSGYWLLVGRIPTLTAWQARRLLADAEGTWVLVDVRSEDVFMAGHIDGAVNWPLARLVAAKKPQDLPLGLQQKALLLLDEAAVKSVPATQHLRGIGVAEAWCVRGGIQEWIRSVEGPEDSLCARWRTSATGTDRLALREPVLTDQVVSVAAFFVVKPIYTLMSLMVIVVLWHHTKSDMIALKWSMLFFLIGENMCALNVLVFKETSYLLEYGHSIGMVICLAFVTYAIFEGLDRRILGFSAESEPCGAINLCGSCFKLTDAPCGLRRLFMMLTVLCVVLALMLPTADWHDVAYNTTVFGQFYHYGHLRLFQSFESWGCATAAIVLFVASLMATVQGRDPALRCAKVTFSAGMGALGFGMLRTVIGGLYNESRVWYGFWEETTELLLLSGICFVLWTFRSQLLPTWDRRFRRWGGQLVDMLRLE